MLYYMDWLTHDFWTRTGGWEFDRPHGAGTSSPSQWEQVREQAPKPVGWVGWCVSSWWPLFSSRSSVLIYIYIYMLFYMSSVFFGLPIVSCSLMINNSLIPGCLWILAFVLNNTLILRIWCSTIPHLPGCFCPWTFFQNIGFNMVPSDPCMSHSYSTWIFCRGVSGFATDCSCDVWCRGLTTCLLQVGPPFGNRFLNTSWAVGLTYWIVYIPFFVFWHMHLYMSWYIISFFGS